MPAPSEPRPNTLLDTQEAYDPRVLSFYWIVGALLLILAGGLAYRQVIEGGAYGDRERIQTERRILEPGQRGRILDREGRALVENHPRLSLVIYLAQLQKEFRQEFVRIRKNYRDIGDRDMPNLGQMEELAHVGVVRRYLEQADAILGRSDAVDATALKRHFDRQLLMPYTLIDDLTPIEFARLVEKLPVNSPLQLHRSSSRFYPYGSAASHVIGYVAADDNVDDSDFAGPDLTTFRMKGTIGRDGLEEHFDDILQGQTGGAIYRVDPAGYKIEPPLEQRPAAPGRDLQTSLDIDLQKAAEDAIGDQIGAAVALDPRTGEVLVLASKPDYDLNLFSPHLAAKTAADIQQRGAWINLAISGVFPPGSTFKTLVSIAGLRHGTLSPDDRSVDCEGRVKIGNRYFSCDNGLGHHGNVDLRDAIAESCDVYFWEHGLAIGPDTIAAEARRFHLGRPTGIELPGETHRMLIPDSAWKKRTQDAPWTDGDTANMSIGQGFVQVTPMVMACYIASLARDETTTVPTLLHDPSRPPQHSEPSGLTPAQRAVLLAGMEGCTEGPKGTARILTQAEALRIPDVRIAGKTGTAQYGDHLDVAWFICFAPIENPQIALAVAVRSDAPGEGFQGGINGAAVADAILKKFFEKRKTLSAKAPASVQTGG